MLGRARADTAWVTGMERAIASIGVLVECAEAERETVVSLARYVADPGGPGDPEVHWHLIDGLREAQALVRDALERARGDRAEARGRGA